MCRARVCEECNKKDDEEVGDDWLGLTGHVDPKCLTYTVDHLNKNAWINLEYERQRVLRDQEIKRIKESKGE